MATDFIAFTEGENDLLTNGIPATCTFALSTSSVSNFTVATAYASFGEITGTGYARLTQAKPTAASGQMAFTACTWTATTTTPTAWPSTVRSIVLLDAGNTKAICAWNLIAGGGARDMSQANTTETVTPTLTTSS